MTLNHARISSVRWCYPRGIFGEMLVGVLLSMFIGICFSVLAAAFVLLLAGGGRELDVPNPPVTNQLSPPPEYKFMLSRR